MESETAPLGDVGCRHRQTCIADRPNGSNGTTNEADTTPGDASFVLKDRPKDSGRPPSTVEDVGVDHRRRYVGLPSVPSTAARRNARPRTSRMPVTPLPPPMAALEYDQESASARTRCSLDAVLPGPTTCFEHDLRPARASSNSATRLRSSPMSPPMYFLG